MKTILVCTVIYVLLMVYFFQRNENSRKEYEAWKIDYDTWAKECVDKGGTISPVVTDRHECFIDGKIVILDFCKTNIDKCNKK